MENTKIAWATHSFSPWIGCSKVHAGCTNCYAEAQSGRFRVTWGPNGTRRKTAESTWRKPLSWDRTANRTGKRARVFPSLCDPFEQWDGPILHHNGRQLLTSYGDGCRKYAYEGQAQSSGDWCDATMDDLRRDFFALIDKTPNLDWLLLTKRPENIRRMWPMVSDGTDSGESDEKYMRNVWLLYSASDQPTLESGLPHLLACRDLVPVIGLSLEPLLGPVDLSGCLQVCCRQGCQIGENEWACCGRPVGVDWVIVGGESGPHARPCNVEWIRSIVEQCKEAGVPVFLKQLGTNVIDYGTTSATHFPDDQLWPYGIPTDYHRVLLADPKGGDWGDWPEDLRVREFPNV